MARQACRLALTSGYDVSVNDASGRSQGSFFDRVWRPEQLPAAMLGAVRMLTDPAETSALLGASCLKVVPDPNADPQRCSWGTDPSYIGTSRMITVTRTAP